MVSVVDALNFPRDFASNAQLHELGLTDDQDMRNLTRLLAEQVEFADIIVLNKTDLVPPGSVAQLRRLLASLNPRARILEAVQGKVPLQQVLNTGLYNRAAAEETPAWQDELAKIHTPETETYGIGSLVYRQVQPFHPQRFWDYAHTHWPGNIIRSKGRFWLASRPGIALEWNQAGEQLNVQPMGWWYAAKPEYALNLDAEAKAELMARWHPVFADRHTELVIIGVGLNEEQIRRELDACLCTPAELAAWPRLPKLPDPWPRWQ